MIPAEVMMSKTPLNKIDSNRRVEKKTIQNARIVPQYLRCDCCRGDDEHDTTEQNMFQLDTLKKTLTKHKDSASTSAL